MDIYELEIEINSKNNEIEDLRKIVGSQKKEITQLKSEIYSLRSKVKNSNLIQLTPRNVNNK